MAWHGAHGAMQATLVQSWSILQRGSPSSVFSGSYIVMSIAISAVVLLVASAGPSWMRLLRARAALAKLPSPPTPSWLLGHLEDIASPQHHLRLFQWARTLGPVYAVRMAISTIVILSDPAAVAIALRLNSGAEKARIVYQIGDTVSERHLCVIAAVLMAEQTLHVNRRHMHPPRIPRIPAVQLRLRRAQCTVRQHGLRAVEGCSKGYGSRFQHDQPQVRRRELGVMPPMKVWSTVLVPPNHSMPAPGIAESDSERFSRCCAPLSRCSSRLQRSTGCLTCST